MEFCQIGNHQPHHTSYIFHSCPYGRVKDIRCVIKHTKCLMTCVSKGNWLSSMYSRKVPLTRLFSQIVARPLASKDIEYQTVSLGSPKTLSIDSLGFQYTSQLISSCAYTNINCWMDLNTERL